MFVAGEEAVASDLAPLLWAIGRVGGLAPGIIPEALELYGDDVPFGIDLQEMTEYAIDQFNKRYSAIERAMA